MPPRSSAAAVLQLAAAASCLGSQWAADGCIPPYQKRSAGPGSLSSLHTAAQLSCQFFAPASCSRTWRVGMAATMSAIALWKALCRNGAREARRPPRDDPVIVRWVMLCVSLGSVCENGVIVYIDHIFDCSDPFVRIDKPTHILIHAVDVIHHLRTLSRFAGWPCPWLEPGHSSFASYHDGPVISPAV